MQVVKCLILVSNLVISGFAFGQGAGAGQPAAPATGGSNDMLKPSQVNTVGEEANPANDSGVFLGAGVGFGQARTTEEGNSPGTAYFLKLEPGYQVRRGTWSRLEVSAELYSGQLSFRTKEDQLGKITAPVTMGLMLHFGYGYSLGQKAFGLLRLGVGTTMAKIKADVGGEKYESDSLSGVSGQIGWLMVAPMTDSLDVTGGISWTQTQFDVDTIKAGSAEFDVDRTVIANVWAAELGLRLRI